MCVENACYNDKLLSYFSAISCNILPVCCLFHIGCGFCSCCIECCYYCNYYYYFLKLDSCYEHAKEARVRVCASKESQQPIDVDAAKCVAAAVSACASFVTESAAMWMCHVQDILQRNGCGRTLLQSLSTTKRQEAMRWHKWWIGRRRSSKLLIRSGKSKSSIEHAQVFMYVCACVLACQKVAISRSVGSIRKYICSAILLRWRWWCMSWQAQQYCLWQLACGVQHVVCAKLAASYCCCIGCQVHSHTRLLAGGAVAPSRCYWQPPACVALSLRLFCYYFHCRWLNGIKIWRGYKSCHNVGAHVCVSISSDMAAQQ